MSAKAIKVLKDLVTHSRTIDIEGGPRVPAGHPRGEFQIEVWRLELTWVGDNPPTLVHAHGPRILKNGNLGAWRSTAYAHPSREPSDFMPAAPEWLTEIIGLQPPLEPRNESIPTPKDWML
jgi:hypothetical protein